MIVDSGTQVTEQVEKQLNKQIDVIKVKSLDPDNSTRRELALIKVNATPETRGQVYDIVSILSAKVVDLSPATLTIEVSDRPERVDLLLQMLEPYGIREMARTGMVAVQKGGGAITGE